MLISHPPLDSSFNNPVDSLLTLSASETTPLTAKGHQGWSSPSDVPQKTEDRVVRPQDDFRTDTNTETSTGNSLEQLLLRQLRDFCQSHQKQSQCGQRPNQQKESAHKDGQSSVQDKHDLLLQQLRDFCLNHQKQEGVQHQDKHQTKVHQGGKKHRLKVERSVMSIDPEDELRCLVENERKLELCGYYYGSLSWLDASQLLRRTRVGTFLVRDSEHHGYLYTLSVQTRKGPTSCRIDYSAGRFRLDSCKDLTHKMPRFDTVTDLVDFYVQLPKYLCSRAVWLDEDSSYDVPVQIYRPLYRAVRSLQHLCRVAVARGLADESSRAGEDPARTTPEQLLRVALETDSNYAGLPPIIKDYLRRYPYTQ